MSAKLAEVVTLYDHNMRDPVATLRLIADQIEAGEYGTGCTVALVLLGNTTEVFGMGDSDAAAIALLLHAGFMRLSRSVEEAGRG